MYEFVFLLKILVVLDVVAICAILYAKKYKGDKYGIL